MQARKKHPTRQLERGDTHLSTRASFLPPQASSSHSRPVSGGRTMMAGWKVASCGNCARLAASRSCRRAASAYSCSCSVCSRSWRRRHKRTSRLLHHPVLCERCSSSQRALTWGPHRCKGHLILGRACIGVVIIMTTVTMNILMTRLEERLALAHHARAASVDGRREGALRLLGLGRLLLGLQYARLLRQHSMGQSTVSAGPNLGCECQAYFKACCRQSCPVQERENVQGHSTLRQLSTRQGKE